MHAYRRGVPRIANVRADSRISIFGILIRGLLLKNVATITARFASRGNTVRQAAIHLRRWSALLCLGTKTTTGITGIMVVMKATTTATAATRVATAATRVATAATRVATAVIAATVVRVATAGTGIAAAT